MKKFFIYVPIVLSLLVLGAHFLRYGNTIVVISIVALMGLLFVPRWWVARLMQLVFALGALEWLRTMVVLIQARMIVDAPYLRLAVILGVVAVVTFLAGVLFQTRELKSFYRLDKSS
jgi:hypothetical protein